MVDVPTCMGGRRKTQATQYWSPQIRHDNTPGLRRTRILFHETFTVKCKITIGDGAQIFRFIATAKETPEIGI
jgi:hypothetical protein